MRIKLTDKICGLPAGDARKFAKALNGETCWSTAIAAELLNSSKTDALTTILRLRSAGYVKEVRLRGSGREWTEWTLTLKGSALAGARAGRPFSRETATKRLKELQERVAVVNSDPYYLYRVSALYVFGSYLRGAALLGDLDVAIEVKHRHEDPGARERAENRRSQRAVIEGVRFANYVAEITYPEREVWKFLKAGSTVISLHRLSSVYRNDFEHRPLYMSNGRDFAPPVEDAESRRPITFRRRRMLEFTAQTETRLANQIFYPGEHIDLLLRDAWTPAVHPAAANNGGAWRSSNYFSEYVPGLYHSEELLTLAHAVYCRGEHYPLFHYRLAEAAAAAASCCPECDGSRHVLWQGDGPTVKCESCGGQEDFSRAPSKKISRK